MMLNCKHLGLGFFRGPGMIEVSKPSKAVIDHVVYAFSQGVVGRQSAMDLLGVGYSQLLDQLAIRQLPLLQLPRAEVERMVGVMLRLID